MNWKSALRYLAGVVLAIVYHLAARVGLQLAYVQQNTSPVWPPSGIALAALLLAGIRYWPGITLGVVGGSLLTGAPLGLALGFGVANTLEALIAALILTRWLGFEAGLGRIRDVLGLVVAALAVFVLILSPWHLQGAVSTILAVGAGLSWAGSVALVKLLAQLKR